MEQHLVGEERVGKFPEEGFQEDSGDMDILGVDREKES